MSKETSPNQREAVTGKIAAIEAKMKRIGMWQSEPLKPEQYDMKEAFGMDTMSFEQWLQFIFIPRVHQILDADGAFPDHSMVAVHAVREFDGHPDASELIELLSEFDALFNG